ncbi:MAG: pentapeptide repeat-containing protein [Thermoguttaceae bacterium]|nr:pentapeptide repeat-containing protein [Thermoguttaceae bacterium]
MKHRNFPALAATLFLGTAIYASVATSIVYAFPPRSTHIIVENLSESDERERGVTKLEHGLDLSRRNLAGVRVTDAFLRDVDFSGSDLTGADLRYTLFLHCNFSNATLKNVAITDSGSFKNCNFSGAKLQNVYMAREDESLAFPAFVECDFTDATLTRVPSFDQWTFKDCVLKNVRLADVRVPRYSSLDVNATANVKKYKEFEGVSFDDAPKNLSEFVLTRTEFLTDVGGVDFTNARLTSVSAPGLSGRQLAQTVNFREKRYEGLALNAANFEKYDFSDAVLTDCRFEKIDFANANFTDAVLLDCSFSAVEGLTLEQLKSTWNWKSGRLDLISFDAALQAQVDAALAEAQPQEAQ